GSFAGPPSTVSIAPRCRDDPSIHRVGQDVRRVAMTPRGDRTRLRPRAHCIPTSRSSDRPMNLARIPRPTASLPSLARGLFGVAGCGTQGADTSATAKKPRFGVAGFDSTNLDTKTKPGDDFYQYANGGWIARTEIPADLPGYSMRRSMTDSTEARLHR